MHTDCIHVLLAGGPDDEALHDAIAVLPDVVVARAQGFEPVIAEVARMRPDVVLVPAFLEPPLDGLQLTRALRWNHPDLAVLLFDARPSELLAEHALLAGAAGVISASAGATALGPWLRDAMRGHLVLDDTVRDSLTLEVESPPEPRDSKLLELIAEGRRTVGELSEALGSSWREVEDLLADVQDRLGLAGRVSLLLYADAFHRSATGS